MSDNPLIVGIGGTTRANSSTERLVRAVLVECTRQGADALLFGSDHLSRLPHYAPENPHRTIEQMELVDAVRRCHGLVLGTPSYHGSISGLVKNAIDLMEDLRKDERTYFDGRAVGIVVTAGGWQACGVTLQAMRGIVHAMRGWPTPMAISINTSEQKPFDEHGVLTHELIKRYVEGVATQLTYFAQNTVPSATELDIL